MKPHLEEDAKRLFEKTGVQVVSGGKRDLGAAIGNELFVKKYLQAKVQKWTSQINNLAEIAKTQPHAAHAGFVHGVRGKWSFAQRTMQKVSELLQPLEDAIHLKFLPALFGDKSILTDTERELYALPAKNGGIAIDDPVKEAPHKNEASKRYTESLKTLIKTSEGNLLLDAGHQKQLKAQIKRDRPSRNKAATDSLRVKLTPPLQRALDLAQEKGASVLFTALPLEKYDLAFKAKRDFFDLIRMRYLKPITNLPQFCACGVPYSVDHSQMCLKAGFIHMRHDTPNQTWAERCKEVFNDVEIEPVLEPLSGEQLEKKTANRDDDARSDTRVRGFWGNQQNAFFDFWIFYPYALSYAPKTLEQLYRQFANVKKGEYEERINKVDNGSFTPMIMTSTGGMGPLMKAAFGQLARKIAQKRKEEYSLVAAQLRCQLSFGLMRSALVCLRGSRDLRPRSAAASPSGTAELFVEEIGLSR